MNKAFFLDRDGVINREVEYLGSPDLVEILPGVIPALKRIRAAGYLAIVVTNQSGVARGMYTEEDVKKVHARISELLAAEGVSVDAFYYCPHHKKYGSDCECRKPLPGMLLAGIRDFDIDPAQSVMIGDRMSDLAAGKAAGCKACYLVRSGYGSEVIARGEAENAKIADDLSDAVEQFLSQ